MADDHPLQESAEELYEDAPCGYLSTRPDGTIVRVNRTLLSWTGHGRDELVGRRFAELLTAGGRIYNETHVAPLLRMQGAVRGIALEIVCADGRRLPVLVNSVLKQDEDGTPLAVRTTLFDATDRKAYERELLEIRDRERAAREHTERLQRITAILAGALVPDQLVAQVGSELAAAVGADHVELTVDGAEAGEPVFEPARAVLPLVAGGRAAGALALVFDPPRELAETERAFLLAAAGQCAQALERARLHERTVEAAEQAAFHAEASRVLDELQGVGERAQRLADLLVRGVADRAWIELRADDELQVAVAADSQGTPREALLRSRHRPEVAAAVGAAMTGAAPQVLAPSHAVLPLRVRGRVLGVVTVERDGQTRRFDPRDLPFLADLAERAALAIENARLYEQQRDVSHTLQQSLLAGVPPQDPRFAVATEYRPAIETLEIGGDWYDTFATGEDHIAVVVGDVVGRGIGAASAMGQLRSAVRALAAAGLGPARILEHLDAFVEQIEPAQWATLVIADVDLRSGRVRLAVAGHPPPVLLEPGSDAGMIWEGRSGPLALRPGPGGRPEAELMLTPQARLLLYTDGLVERRDESLDDGLARLVDEFAARRATPLPALVGELADAMLLGEHRRDDVCLLCLELCARG